MLPAGESQWGSRVPGSSDGEPATPQEVPPRLDGDVPRDEELQGPDLWTALVRAAALRGGGCTPSAALNLIIPETAKRGDTDPRRRNAELRLVAEHRGRQQHDRPRARAEAPSGGWVAATTAPFAPASSGKPPD